MAVHQGPSGWSIRRVRGAVLLEWHHRGPNPTHLKFPEFLHHSHLQRDGGGLCDSFDVLAADRGEHLLRDQQVLKVHFHGHIRLDRSIHVPGVRIRQQCVAYFRPSSLGNFLLQLLRPQIFHPLGRWRYLRSAYCSGLL